MMALQVAQQPRLMTSGEPPQLPSAPPAAVVRYGPLAAHVAELRVPEGKGRFPVVAIIHGGCWGEYADIKYTAPLASALTREGWATWNLEYRGVHQDGGGWPGTFEDVGKGLDAVRDAASRWLLDESRVVAIGHSAGGHLALWAAARPGYPAGAVFHADAPLRLSGVVSMAGIVDLEAFYTYGQGPCGDREQRLMGGPPGAQPERYALASPRRRLPLGVPQRLLWGALDEIVPGPLFGNYERAAREAGDRVESLTIDGIGHHEFGSPHSAAYPAIVSAIRELLRDSRQSR
jgi:acetyl esterase/lipase